MKILVVEDTRPMAKSFIELLSAAGHEVQWVVGFSSVEDLEGIFPEGNREPVDADSFDLALVDGDLEDHQEGKDIVPHLIERGVVCVGMSTMPDMNSDMIEAGASLAAGKVAVLVALADNRFSADELLEATRDTQTGLTELEGECRTSSETRAHAEEVFLKYLKEE